MKKHKRYTYLQTKIINALPEHYMWNEDGSAYCYFNGTPGKESYTWELCLHVTHDGLIFIFIPHQDMKYNFGNHTSDRVEVSLEMAPKLVEKYLKLKNFK